MPAHTHPNIIYIHSHDTGRSIQPYGYAVPTPNLQRLADEGVLLRRAFCAAPTCSPSRAALLTGQAAHSAGMIGLVNRGFDLADPSRHLLHTLRAAGYHTVLAGLQHIHHDVTQLGFDAIIAPDASTRVADVAPVAADFIRSTPSQPFFMDVGFFETHREFPAVAPDIDPAAQRPPAPLPDTPATRADMAAFAGMARTLDQGVGMVLDALDAAELTANTLVIYTTDHGVAFPGCKGTLTDHGMGVALILRGPGQLADGAFAGGRTVDALVSQIDLFPTLCDLLAIDSPAWLQGTSMLPVLCGHVDEINDAVFAEVTYHAAYEPQRAVRTGRYKYIRRWVAAHTGHTGPVLANCDDSVSKDVWLAHGWAARPVPAEQLYDLIFDPNEAHNVAADPAYQDVLADMRARLDAWMARTDDPLLAHAGVVPPPRGAQVNRMDAVSPNEAPDIVG